MTAIPGPRRAWAEARTGPGEVLAGAVLLVLIAAGAITGSLSIVGALAGAALALLATIRDARWFLFAYVALVPFDGSAALGEIGTLSRLAGIGFAVVHLARRRGSLRIDTIGAAGWAFAGFAMASYLWSIDRPASLPQLITLVQLVVVAVLVADLVLERPEAARPIALLYAFSASAMGAVGLAAWVTDPSALPGGRAIAFEGQDPAQFAAMLIPAVFVLVWEMLRRPNVLVLAGLAVSSVAVLASGTRSAWVAVTVVVAIGLVPRMTRRQQVGVAVGVVAIVVLAVVVPTLNELTLGRLAAVIESGGTGRTDIWTIGMGVWTQNPFVGVGYGAFPSALTLEVVRATDIPTIDTGFLMPPIGSHSILVGSLVELGLIGTGCLAAFLWSVVRPRGGSDMEQMARFAVLAMLAQALFLDIVGRKQLWLFVALATGLAAGRVTRGLQRHRPPPEP